MKRESASRRDERRLGGVLGGDGVVLGGGFFFFFFGKVGVQLEGSLGAAGVSAQERVLEEGGDGDGRGRDDSAAGFELELEVEDVADGAQGDAVPRLGAAADVAAGDRVIAGELEDVRLERRGVVEVHRRGQAGRRRGLLTRRRGGPAPEVDALDANREDPDPGFHVRAAGHRERACEGGVRGGTPQKGGGRGDSRAEECGGRGTRGARPSAFSEKSALTSEKNGRGRRRRNGSRSRSSHLRVRGC